MYVYIIRHGQSRGNIDYSLRDAEPFHPLKAELERKDPSLTRLGRVQAELAGKRLSQIEFDAVFCGPLHRQIDTAAIVMKHQKKKVKIEVLSDLTEVGLEGYAGTPTEFYGELFPDVELIPCSDPSPTGGPGVIPSSAENSEGFRLRGRRLVEYLKKRFSGSDTILLSTSAMFGGAIVIPALLELTDNDIDTGKNFEFNNTCISMVELTDDGKKIVHFSNDITHLSLPEGEDSTKYPF